jgi:hypothetical protein
LALPCVSTLAAEAEPYSANKRYIRYSVKENRVIFNVVPCYKTAQSKIIASFD